MKSPTQSPRHYFRVSVKTANTLERFLADTAAALYADSTLSAAGVQITRPSKHHKGALSGTRQALERLCVALSALTGARFTQAAGELSGLVAALPVEPPAVEPPAVEPAPAESAPLSAPAVEPAPAESAPLSAPAVEPPAPAESAPLSAPAVEPAPAEPAPAVEPPAPRRRAPRPTAVYLRIPESSYIVVFNNLREKSANRKTGPVVQSYLLDLDRLRGEPNVFGAKCQSCPLVKTCYVSQDKLSVRKALVSALGGDSSSYVELNAVEELLPLLKGRFVRFGTYGDPSALPLEWLERITPLLRGWTGYTHFYDSISPEYNKYYMASVESPATYARAIERGYRVFYVALKGAPPAPGGLLECLNVSRGLTCRECGLCNGFKGRTSSPVRSIWISEH